MTGDVVDAVVLLMRTRRYLIQKGSGFSRGAENILQTVVELIHRLRSAGDALIRLTDQGVDVSRRMAAL